MLKRLVTGNNLTTCPIEYLKRDCSPLPHWDSSPVTATLRPMLQREYLNGIAVLRLQHGKAHALDVELARALRDAAAELGRSDTVRAVVLTGTGSIFCAGVDLFRILEGGPAYIDAYVPLLEDMLFELFQLPRPVVAAINGHAIAGGCVLAAACDYRIMANGPGTIGVPELRVGLPFPLVGIEILRFATSETHLQELVYRGKTYAVAEAYERGLVDEVADPDRLLDHALDVADELSAEPSARFRITKQQLRTPTLERVKRDSAATQVQVLDAWKDPSSTAAIRSYVAGMRPAR